MKKIYAVAIVLSVMFWSMAPFTAFAAADSVCVDRTKFIERLKRHYREYPVSSGINFNGVVVEVFASEEGHFTILITRPDGVSCLIASGDNWQVMPVLKAEIGI